MQEHKTIYINFITFTASSQALGNVMIAKTFIDKLIKTIDMRQLGRTIAFDVPLQIRKQGGDTEQDEGGVSALALISTSGVELHTWPEPDANGKIDKTKDGSAYVMVSSCRKYDKQSVVDLVKRFYNTTNVSIKIGDTITLD